MSTGSQVIIAFSYRERATFYIVFSFSSPMTDLGEIVKELKPSCLIGAAAIPKV
jgi:hypothetical protein